jgi:hypothetical protein
MSSVLIGKLVVRLTGVLLGIYFTLVGFRVVGKKPGESIKYDEWYRRFGKLLKIVGPFIILFESARIIFNLTSSR